MDMVTIVGVVICLGLLTVTTDLKEVFNIKNYLVNEDENNEQ